MYTIIHREYSPATTYIGTFAQGNKNFQAIVQYPYKSKTNNQKCSDNLMCLIAIA